MDRGKLRGPDRLHGYLSKPQNGNLCHEGKPLYDEGSCRGTMSAMNKSYMLTHEGNGSLAGLYFATLEEAKGAAELERGSSALKWAERLELPGAPRAFVTPGFVIVECDAPFGY